MSDDENQFNNRLADQIDAWQRTGVVDTATADRLRATSGASPQVLSSVAQDLHNESKQSIPQVAAFIGIALIFIAGWVGISTSWDALGNPGHALVSIFMVTAGWGVYIYSRHRESNTDFAGLAGGWALAQFAVIAFVLAAFTHADASGVGLAFMISLIGVCAAVVSGSTTIGAFATGLVGVWYTVQLADLHESEVTDDFVAFAMALLGGALFLVSVGSMLRELNESSGADKKSSWLSSATESMSPALVTLGLISAGGVLTYLSFLHKLDEHLRGDGSVVQFAIGAIILGVLGLVAQLWVSTNRLHSIELPDVADIIGCASALIVGGIGTLITGGFGSFLTNIAMLLFAVGLVIAGSFRDRQSMVWIGIITGLALVTSRFVELADSLDSATFALLLGGLVFLGVAFGLHQAHKRWSIGSLPSAPTLRDPSWALSNNRLIAMGILFVPQALLIVDLARRGVNI